MLAKRSELLLQVERNLHYWVKELCQGRTVREDAILRAMGAGLCIPELRSRALQLGLYWLDVHGSLQVDRTVLKGIESGEWGDEARLWGLALAARQGGLGESLRMAEMMLKRVDNVGAGDAPLWVRLAEAAWALECWHAAESLAGRVVSEPGEVGARAQNILGMLALRGGEAARAEVFFREALDGEPLRFACVTIWLNNNLAWALGMQGRSRAALTAAGLAAVDARGGDWPWLQQRVELSRAALSLAAGELDAARQALERGRQLGRRSVFRGRERVWVNWLDAAVKSGWESPKAKRKIGTLQEWLAEN